MRGESSSPLLGKIDRASREFPDHPAVISDDACLTHAEVATLSRRVSASLWDRGVRKGDRVALYAHNGVEFAVLYLGIVRAGAVVVPLNLLIHTPEILHVLKDAGVMGILTQESLLERLEDVLPQLPMTPFVIALRETASPNENLAELLRAEHGESDLIFDPSEDLVAILYTSGTTGFPKGAMLTHANLAANTQSVHEAMCWRSGLDRVLVVLPMFHAFAATVGLLTPLTNGSAVIPLHRFEPDAVSLAVERHEATIFLGVPSMYSVLLRLPEPRIPRFASVRFAVSGGAAMPVAVMRAFEDKFNLKVYEGDGPTECSPVTCVNPIGGLQKSGTVGLPVPGVEMKIVASDGRDCPDGEVGEIAVRGANVMKGYWGQPMATEEVLRDGWLYTGDLGTRDTDGYFSIVDRKKDLIIVNGMNVYPRMVEEILYGIEGIREVAVIGEPDKLHGEVPVAYLALDEGSILDEKILREKSRTLLGRHQVPKRFIILPVLPRNAAGKILKRELRLDGERERGIDLVRT